MEQFINFSSKVMPLDSANVDTDQIIPKQFLKRIERTGFGEFLLNIRDQKYYLHRTTSDVVVRVSMPHGL